MSTANEKPLALVTGATSGIGLALARLLAEGGHRVVLVARDRERLAALAAELAATYGTTAEALPTDLGDPAAVAELTHLVRTWPVEVLVNNAGFGVHGSFAETPLERERAMIEVQLQAAVALAKACVPGMVARKRGRILNVGSLYSFAAVPYQAVYGACKSFLLSFGDALGDELRGSGVTVTTLCPGSTRTAFRERSGVGGARAEAGMSAEDVAQAGYDAMLRGERVVVPGRTNRAFAVATRLLPGRVAPAFLRVVNELRGVNRKA